MPFQSIPVPLKSGWPGLIVILMNILRIILHLRVSPQIARLPNQLETNRFNPLCRCFNFVHPKADFVHFRHPSRGRIFLRKARRSGVKLGPAGRKHDREIHES